MAQERQDCTWAGVQIQDKASCQKRQVRRDGLKGRGGERERGREGGEGRVKR